MSSSCMRKSASAPAISTPVGPPPTMHTWSLSWLCPASRLERSSSEKIRSRMASAWLRVYIGIACSSAPGVPK